MKIKIPDIKKVDKKWISIIEKSEKIIFRATTNGRRRLKLKKENFFSTFSFIILILLSMYPARMKINMVTTFKKILVTIVYYLTVTGAFMVRHQ